MSDYLLDTNILSYWYDSKRGENAKVVAAVESARQPDQQSGYISRFFVSIVTLGEMEYGHRVASSPDPELQAEYAKFVREQCPVSLEMTAHVAVQYGEMRAWLFDNCSPKASRSRAKRAEQLVCPITGELLQVDENDLWIAAQAMTYNLVFVTNDNRGNFGKVLAQYSDTLRVEYWAR